MPKTTLNYDDALAAIAEQLNFTIRRVKENMDQMDDMICRNQLNWDAAA